MTSTGHISSDEKFTVRNGLEDFAEIITVSIHARVEDPISAWKQPLRIGTAAGKKQTDSKRIVRPTPSKVFPRGVKLLEPLDGNAMDGRQITEDQVNELRLPGPVFVYKPAKSLGVSCRTIAHDEHFGYAFRSRSLGIRRVHTAAP